MPGSAVTPALSLPLLSIELVLFCVALIFSTICTVIGSPTSRARWSSNKGRYCVAWKIAPLLTAGAATGCGSAAVGSAMSTLGRGFSVVQPAKTRAAARRRCFMCLSESIAVIPAKAGIHQRHVDPGFRRDDGRSQLAEPLQHLIRRLDRLRVELVGALRLDHRDQLFDDVDVGGLDEALAQRAEAVLARR